MKKGISLLFALVATAVVAASAQANRQAAVSAVSCKSTFTLPFVTPLTGGAAFLGQEQMSWAKYAVKTLAPGLGLKIKLVGGDTPVEQGAPPRARTRASSPFWARRRPARSPRRRRRISRRGWHTSPRPPRAPT